MPHWHYNPSLLKTVIKNFFRIDSFLLVYPNPSILLWSFEKNENLMIQFYIDLSKSLQKITLLENKCQLLKAFIIQKLCSNSST